MLLVGLTGGIGSGKSTVAQLMADRGAIVVEADDLARDAVAPGTDGLRRIREVFGPGVLTAEGALDRRALGEVVFADPERRRALEAIVHPEVARRFGEEIERHRATDRVVVYAVPLLVEQGLAPAFDVVVTVAGDVDTRIARVIAQRGLSEPEVRERLAVQASDEERAEVADRVIANDGSVEELERAVDRLWADLALQAEET